MKTFFIPLAFLALLGLPSCVDLDTGYLGGGHSYGGGGSYSPGYYSPGYYSPGYSRPYYGSDYAYSGRGNRYDNGGSIYRGVDRHDNNRGRDDGKIKLVRGNDGGHPNRPEGYHTKDWYKHRGYDLSDYAHKHEDGKVHKGDDDDKKHRHR